MKEIKIPRLNVPTRVTAFVVGAVVLVAGLRNDLFSAKQPQGPGQSGRNENVPPRQEDPRAAEAERKRREQEQLARETRLREERDRLQREQELRKQEQARLAEAERRQPQEAQTPESLSKTEHSLAGDAIVHFRVDKIDGRKMTIAVDYKFNPQHGDKVFAGAWLQGVSSGFTPSVVPSPGQGTALIPLTIDGPGTSTNIEIFLYEFGRPERFAYRLFPYRMRFE